MSHPLLRFKVFDNSEVFRDIIEGGHMRGIWTVGMPYQPTQQSTVNTPTDKPLAEVQREHSTTI